MVLDKIDRKIISQLQLDGRTSLKDLSELVGYTSMGVKKRINKLLENGDISVSALVNVDSSNLCAAVVLLEVDSSESMNKLLKRFRECPRVINLFSTLGGYNITAFIIAEDQSTLDSISIEKCSLRSNEGIRRSEIYPISEVHYSPFILVRQYLAKRQREISPCNVECGYCQRYEEEKCVGCPATHYYRGSL
jgi:DNA-binding Lrp family transcriptional regulator